jgi:hypothetical protein
LHLFVARARFKSLADIYAFIDQTYTEDGERIPSRFMLEVELSDYDPMCIESFHSARPLPLAELLRGASFGAQWIAHLDAARVAESAICVFSPNAVANPERTSLEYVGAIRYERPVEAVST